MARASVRVAPLVSPRGAFAAMVVLAVCALFERASFARPHADRPKKVAPDERRTTGCADTCDHARLFAEPPELAPIDREVLALCPDNPSAAVSREELRRFVLAHYDDPKLQRAFSVAGRPGSGAGVKTSNVDWLVELWIGNGPRNAFTHVFCGDDWTKKKLGGLHWLPRFATLEAEGKICYGGPAKGASALVGDQYLVRYAGVAPFSCGEKSMGGFAKVHDPLVLLATGTRAFVECCTREGKKQGGVYQAPDLSPLSYRVWCGTRNGTYGIASLYPTNERPTCGAR